MQAKKEGHPAKDKPAGFEASNKQDGDGLSNFLKKKKR
jgi:hypothetical protein